MLRLWYVKQFIKAIDPTIKVKHGSVLETQISKRVVYVAFKNHQEDMDRFRWYLDNHGAESDVNTLIYGILHEVGHLETTTRKNFLEREEGYILLGGALANDLITVDEAQKEYMDLPNEKDATEWAINFVKRKPHFVRVFQKLIGDEKAV